MTSSDHRWSSARRLERAFVPESIWASKQGGGLMFGWRGGPTPADREAIIAHIPPKGEPTLASFASGWIRCGDARNGVAFAVHARPGPQFALLRCTSNGWESLGEIPGISVARVLAVSRDEAWLLGADTLLRWRSGVFTSHEVSGQRDPTRDRLFFTAGVVLLSTPEGLFLAREGGRRWGHRAVDGAHVRAICAPYVAALRADRVWIGRLSGAFVDWALEIVDAGDPCGFGVSPSGLQLAMLPRDLETHCGIALIHDATNAGFRTELLRVPPSAAWIGVQGGRNVLALAADRRILEACA